ncbi:plastocyanin/azurin family copper-binding protein [Natrialbaceae archaeon A-CW3]
MTRTDYVHVSRRRLLSALGGAAGIGLMAGCLADRNVDPGDNDSDTETKPEADDTDSSDRDDETPDDQTSDDETSDDGTSDDESNDTEDGADDSVAGTSEGDEETDPWDVEEFVFDARSSGFTGVEPAVIADEENPELVLTEGEEYTLTWNNVDGHTHNIEVWDDDGTVVDDYATDPMDVEGDSQSLTIEATPAMAEYVCAIHAGWGKRGDLEIRSAE